MAYEFKLPDLGEGLTEGEIARWLVAEGQELAEDDPLVEIQTDKTTVEIPSPAAGIVTKILVGEGEVVPVGTVLVVIGGDAARAGRAVPTGRQERKCFCNTKSFRRAGSRSGDPDRAPDRAGAGRRSGFVERYGAERPDHRGRRPQRRRGLSVTGTQSLSGPRSEGRREPVRGVRRLIVEHLTTAHREVPAVTFVEECDFTGLDLARLLPLTLQATAASLQEFPELNARLEGDEIVYLERYDIGVAVQTDQGLVVPVVRGCDTTSLEDLTVEVARLAEAARDGTLKPEELRDGTFTVTSAGKLGGLVVTPLVNHPEVGILGIHRIAPRPVVVDGEIVVRHIGNVSVTFDHRVVDGARAAAFTLSVIARLESGLPS